MNKKLRSLAVLDVDIDVTQPENYSVAIQQMVAFLEQLIYLRKYSF